MATQTTYGSKNVWVKSHTRFWELMMFVKRRHFHVTSFSMEHNNTHPNTSGQWWILTAIRPCHRSKDNVIVTVVTIRFVTMFVMVCVCLVDVKDVSIAKSTETRPIEMPNGQWYKGWRYGFLSQFRDTLSHFGDRRVLARVNCHNFGTVSHNFGTPYQHFGTDCKINVIKTHFQKWMDFTSITGRVLISGFKMKIVRTIVWKPFPPRRQDLETAPLREVACSFGEVFISFWEISIIFGEISKQLWEVFYPLKEIGDCFWKTVFPIKIGLARF